MKQKRLTDYKYAKYHASPALKLISPSIIFITLAFAGTVLLALSRENPTVIILLLGLSLVYPIVGVLSFVQSVPKWNYIELKPDGIRITTAGFKLKFIAWSMIKDFFIIPEASCEIIGVGYKRNPSLKWWITQDFHDEIAKELEAKQQELNDRLKILTSDNKNFQVTASYLLDLAQRAEELFKASDERLQQKLLEYLLSNIELNDKKLSFVLNDPFKTIAETKKKSPVGSESAIWCP